MKFIRGYFKGMKYFQKIYFIHLFIQGMKFFLQTNACKNSENVPFPRYFRKWLRHFVPFPRYFRKWLRHFIGPAVKSPNFAASVSFPASMAALWKSLRTVVGKESLVFVCYWIFVINLDKIKKKVISLTIYIASFCFFLFANDNFDSFFMKCNFCIL